MPNYCENILRVKGENIQDFINGVSGYEAEYFTDEDMKRIYANLGVDPNMPKKRKKFTFNSLVPVPKEVLDAGYNDSGYHWQINNWGTKWDVNDESMIIEQSENEIKYVFSTAWSPPLQWVKKASKVYPDLTFELAYAELGNFFAGKLVVQGGNILEEFETSEVDEMKEFLIDELEYDSEFVEDMFAPYEENDIEEMV